MGSNASSTDVLIVGAGPTGLVLAAELARRGTPFRLIEKRPRPANICKAAGIMPRTLEVFEDMGVLEAFLDAGVPAAGVTIFAKGRNILNLDFTDLDAPHATALGLEQYRTEELLTDHLQRLGGAVERGAGLQGFAQDEHWVTAFIVRDDGSEETIEAKYLVGCDGAHSAVRRMLKLPFPGAAFDEHYLIAHLSVDWDLPHDRMVELHASTGTITAFPVPEGRWAVSAELDASQWDDGHGESPTLTQIQQLFAARCHVPAKVHSPLWMSYYRVNHRQAPSYRLGRVFVAGDAAHIHSPVGGQGMNTGMQDAYNLAWKLALVCRGRAGPRLLDSYHAERHPVGKWTLRLATYLQGELNRRSRVTMCVRDCLTQAAGQIGPMRDFVGRWLGELSYHYRGSPIVEEHRSGCFGLPCGGTTGPQAGDRAVDALVATDPRDVTGPAIRMHELLRGPLHKLFLFEGMDGPRQRAEAWPELRRLIRRVRRRYGDFLEVFLVTPNFAGSNYLDLDIGVVHDGDHLLHDRYGARGPCLYLIRPDGYVGYRAKPPDGDQLEDYLKRTYGLGSRPAFSQPNPNGTVWDVSSTLPSPCGHARR